jgi:transcriptional regulator with XRE-family HTH domain
LTQVELAGRLGVTQQVVAAWERRNVALRAEQIKILAEALGTTADYLIGIAVTWRGTKGPSGKVRQVFEQVSKLPRRQQQKVVEFVEAFVQHKAAAG